MLHSRLYLILPLVLTTCIAAAQTTGSPTDFLARGNARVGKGDFAGVIADFTRAIEIDETALLTGGSSGFVGISDRPFLRDSVLPWRICLPLGNDSWRREKAR